MTVTTAHNFEAGKAGFSLRLFRLRYHVLKLTQSQFADRFGLTYGMVRDLEQGRVKPTRAARLYIAAVEAAPELMLQVAERERSAA